MILGGAATAAAAAAAASAPQIAVVGGGAAGLVASRHLLRCGFQPTILEASNCLGGLWSNDRSCAGSNVRTWDSLTPNLSRFTTCFSDFPWSSVVSTSSQGSADWFPSKQQLNAYLTSYSAEYLAGELIRLNCQVLTVRRGRSGLNSAGYSVQWKNLQSGVLETHDFDGVVIASGFFSQSVIPDALQPLQPLQQPTEENNCINNLLYHSSEYRSPEQFRDKKKVVVVGASFSALEIAADLALEYSSGDCDQTNHKQTVTVVLPRIPWLIPRYAPLRQSNGGHPNPFVPVDVAFYQRRQAFPQSEKVMYSKLENQQSHTYLKNWLGSRQEALIGVPPDFEAPIFRSVSDTFLNHVAAGTIQVVQGRAVSSSQSSSSASSTGDDAATPTITTTTTTTTATVLLDSGEVIDNVDAIISCTGYRPQLAPLLDEDLLQTLEFDQSDSFCPLILAYDTFHPQLDRLGFVGMYRGPYFGVMELQARLLSELWKQQSRTTYDDEDDNNDLSLRRLLDKDSGNEYVQTLLQESRHIRSQRPRPQFPHNDYAGLLDRLANELNIVPHQLLPKSTSETAEASSSSTGLNLMFPPLYQPDSKLAQSAMDDLQSCLESCREGQTISKVLMTAMALGKYQFTREIRHYPIGVPPEMISKLQPDRLDFISGTAKFVPLKKKAKQPVKASNLIVESENNDSPAADQHDLLYREDGIWASPQGNFEVFREYEYTHNTNSGDLEIYFVEGGKRAHLFLSMKFQPNNNNDKTSQSSSSSWIASNDHLCILDLYKGTFEVEFDGIAVQRIIMEYKVDGPKKNYVSRTILDLI